MSVGELFKGYLKGIVEERFAHAHLARNPN